MVDLRTRAAVTRRVSQPALVFTQRHCAALHGRRSAHYIYSISGLAIAAIHLLRHCIVCGQFLKKTNVTRKDEEITREGIRGHRYLSPTYGLFCFT